ncbi:g5377 [Coccomyxa elongata]
MASPPAEVAGEGADAHPAPGNPFQDPGDGCDVHMEEAQGRAHLDEGESDYHVFEFLADEARAASERAEAAIHKQAPIDEPVLRVAVADFAAAIQELMKRVQNLEINLHAANDLVETLRREVAVLKDRFSGRRGREGCAMLNLDQTQYVKVAEMQLVGKALLRWHQAHRTDELTPSVLPTWQQFLQVMTPMFAEADRDAKAEAKWESLSLKKPTVQGMSAYAREVEDAYVEMGVKRPSTHNAWMKYKQGLGNETLHLITMTETACKDTDPAWTGPLPGRIAAATKLLHRLVTDTTVAKSGLGGGAGGPSGGGHKRSAKEAGVQSSTGPASKRQSGGASGSGGSSKSTDAQIEQLRRTRAAFTDPDEPKPFSKQLMDHCRAKGLCLFCMKGKIRMFDCQELQKDSLCLKRLKNAYLARCIPVDHGS